MPRCTLEIARNWPIPKFKPTSPITVTYPRKGGKVGLLSRISFALLSYASIDHCEEKTLSKTKNCRLCCSDFECKGLLGCWCRSMDISREQLGELSKRTSDCICPNCLGTKMETCIPESILVKPYYSAQLTSLSLNFAMPKKKELLL